MKQINNDNAANRTSYVGHVYNVGEKVYKNKILDFKGLVVKAKLNKNYNVWKRT